MKPPWGDYGRVLLSGMTAHLGRTREGLLRLERTGPFVPPITLAGPGNLLVTDAFRAELEQSPLAGLKFRAVEKTHIARLGVYTTQRAKGWLDQHASAWLSFAD